MVVGVTSSNSIDIAGSSSLIPPTLWCDFLVCGVACWHLAVTEASVDLVANSLAAFVVSSVDSDPGSPSGGTGAGSGRKPRYSYRDSY